MLDVIHSVPSVTCMCFRTFLYTPVWSFQARQQQVLGLSRPPVLTSTPGWTSTDSRWPTSTRARRRRRPRVSRWEGPLWPSSWWFFNNVSPFYCCFLLPAGPLEDRPGERLELERMKITLFITEGVLDLQRLARLFVLVKNTSCRMTHDKVIFLKSGRFICY